MNILRPLLLALSVSSALATAEPVRRIDIYVSPYYASGNPPQVSIGLSYEHLLASEKREDILRARDTLAQDNRMISPMSMMVLAIRLYDIGERDDSVFWFYAAKNRFLVLMNSVDADASALQEARHAMNAFVQLAGPYINSYAFCDPANQQAIARRALQWTKDNPYGMLGDPRLTALPGDLQTHIQKALDGLQQGIDQEAAQLADPAFLENFRAQRRANNVDEQFCWK